MVTIRWTVGAQQNLQEIVAYIQRDSAVYAAQVAARIITAVDRLADFPKLGRMVPEYHEPIVPSVMTAVAVKVTGSVAKTVGVTGAIVIASTSGAVIRMRTSTSQVP